jgi:hypothetical protein
MALTYARKGEAFPGSPPMANGNRPKTFDLPYTEWGLKHWLEYDPVKNGDYTGVCLPFGFSRSINAPRGLQIMQNNDALAFLFEQNTWHIWVPTNGVKWPAGYPEFWNGQSVGHWEGDTLVIVTDKFNGYTRLVPQAIRIAGLNNRDPPSNGFQHNPAYGDHSRSQSLHAGLDDVRTWRIQPATNLILSMRARKTIMAPDRSITPWKRPTDEELKE